MPRGDRTGPRGMGPMTGRGAGFCAGYGVPGYANPLPGGGAGFWGGRGGGRGWRNWYYATGLPGWARAGLYPAWGAAPYGAAPAREDELRALKDQEQTLRSTLEDVQQRIGELSQSEE